jgi:predicted nucleic acid-binding protein
MIIVSDTTPIRYLIEIEEIYVLEKLFGELIDLTKMRRRF